MCVVFVYTGRGGFGYLKQWKWWAGLILSKSPLSSLLPISTLNGGCHLIIRHGDISVTVFNFVCIFVSPQDFGNGYLGHGLA